MKTAQHFLPVVAFLTLVSASAVRADLPDHKQLTNALREVVKEKNGGLGLHMWATIVDRDGEVRAVAFSGKERGDQWPGSRVISAQKANTANAFSLPGLALSTANLYTAVQPGGSLYGLQHSNPVDAEEAYDGRSSYFGTAKDPLVGEKIGGVNVFGGGLALYDSKGKLLGALGVSGDTSCADHNIAWKLRDRLGLDFVPAGVSPTRDDNIIFTAKKGTTAAGFIHPECGGGERKIGENLPKSHPIGKVKGKPVTAEDESKNEIAELTAALDASKKRQAQLQAQVKNLADFKNRLRRDLLTIEPLKFKSASAVNYSDRGGKLKAIREALKIFPTAKITLIGHADDSKYAETNREVSENRAKFFAAYLTQNGVPKDQIVWRGAGDTKPSEKAGNKRVDILVRE